MQAEADPGIIGVSTRPAQWYHRQMELDQL
jgi:hypothetical protein